MPLSVEKRQKILIIVLIVLLTAIIAILYYAFRGGGTLPVSITPSGFLPTAPVSGEGQPAISVQKQIESIKLDTSIFDTSLYKSLKIYGEIPIQVQVEVSGRDNPFLPF